MSGPPDAVVYLHGFASGPGSKKARFFGDRFAARGVPFLVPDLAAGNFSASLSAGNWRLWARQWAAAALR